jgi:hypothetical protein
MKQWRRIALGICCVVFGLFTYSQAALIDVTVDGSDAIFLAGRTDLVIPPASAPWSVLIRHGGATPEEILETLPPQINVNAGDVIRVADPAVGGVSFFNGYGDPYYGPDGNGVSGSNLSSLGGISGYIGPQGPLTGVFLNADIPLSGAPATLDFSSTGIGTNFLSLSPQLGQIFYIGNGVTGDGTFQTFIAPTGATRLFLGIPDGFGFVGAPGAYDDNDGQYKVTIGINQIPTPESPTMISLLFGIAFIGISRVIRRR